MGEDLKPSFLRCLHNKLLVELAKRLDHLLVVKDAVANDLTNSDINKIIEQIKSCVWITLHYSFHEARILQ